MEEEEEEEEERYGILWICMEIICVWNYCMDGYVFVWNLYGSVCMDISGPIPRV